MNDKTAIEALTLALASMKERRTYCEQWEYKYGKLWDGEENAIQHAREAIAAIDAEKPVEDIKIASAKILCDICHREGSDYECAGCQGYPEDILVPFTKSIENYAASYHAEQCKACPCGRLGIYLKEEVYLCTRPKQDCHARSNGLCLNALRCLPLPEAPIV